MTIKQRYEAVLAHFAQVQPEPATELTYGNPFQLLVAVMLSAQCTDKRVNLVTPALFDAYPTPAAMADASVDDILTYITYIKSVSYPNSKAQHLRETAIRLRDDFGGEVPQTMEELTSLPGVGRKTANVVLGAAFGKATIPVDTHVFRVARRIGLSQGKTPAEVERDLARHIPEAQRFKAHHWILLHGRYVCRALRPDCEHCAISHLCKSHKKNCPA